MKRTLRISARHLRGVTIAMGLALVLVATVVGTEPAEAQTFTLLYTFTGGTDGGEPHAGLIQDTAGNLYGTTPYGGASGAGVVFKLTP